MGVCIGFRTEALKVAAWEELGKLGQVIYINKEEGGTFDGLLDSIANPKSNQPMKLPRNAQAALDAVNAAPFYKSEAFSYEREWRVKIGGAVDLRRNQTIEFRVGASTLVPYKALSFRQHSKQFIAEIIIGPSPNLPISVDAMNQFLKSKGISEIDITGSTVSFRSW